MKHYIFALLAACFISGCVKANDVIYPAEVMQPSDPELRNLEWNRYTAGNFTILSIDDSQGRWMKANVEQIKTWCITRWGFPDLRFSKECRIFCVPNKSIMKKLFGVETSRAEVRKKDGVFEMTAMWLVLEGQPGHTVPAFLTEICLAEFEHNHNVKFGMWFKRGASQLSSTFSEIRSQISRLPSSSSIFSTEKMFTMTEEDYNKETPENRSAFDRQAAALCLLLRKEFGEAKLQGFLRLSVGRSPQDALRHIYGFSGYEHFDRSYARFMRDLNRDVLGGKTPDAYLEIKPVS